MIRIFFTVTICAILVWAPWLSRGSTNALVDTVLQSFGPLPKTCYDDHSVVLQDGFVVRWYPFGRLVHTCRGDYVVWMWGAVEELGGVYKKSKDIQRTHALPLSCAEVLERKLARQGTSTMPTVATTSIASHVDFTLFPEAKEQEEVLRKALQNGPNFAGGFTVAVWDCGSACKKYAVMDSASGRLLAYHAQTEYGVSFSTSSTLLITNPKELIPPLPETEYEAENAALSLARVAREYYLLTFDVLSNTNYLERVCTESATTGVVSVEDNQLWASASATSSTP